MTTYRIASLLAALLLCPACSEKTTPAHKDASSADVGRADSGRGDRGAADAKTIADAAGPATGPFKAKTAFFVTGQQWRYDESGVETKGWQAPGFDDSKWPEGHAPLGVGFPSKETEFDKLPRKEKTFTIYLRRAFSIAGDPAKIDKLELYLAAFDGYIAYLNGKEIKRDNLPATGVTATTPALTHKDPAKAAMETVDISAHKAKLVKGQNVLAVELHRWGTEQQIATSFVWAWEARLQFTTKHPHVTRGPYLQLGTPTGVRVRWRTSVPTASRVLYGTAQGKLTKSVKSATAVTEHDVELTGLAPDTRYYYAVGDDKKVLAGGDAQTFFFAAPASKAAPIRVWILGDSGFKNYRTRKVRDAYVKRTAGARTNLWLMVGDNSSNGSDDDYQYGLFELMFERMAATSVLWPAPGNHDLPTQKFKTMSEALSTSAHFASFTLPTKAEAGGEASGTEAYYAFDHGTVHFVCLESNFAPGEATLGAAQEAWLKKDLARAKQAGAEWLIAYFHHAPYSKGGHDSDGAEYHMKMMRWKYGPILEAGGVDLVFAGHSHDYERSYLIDGHYGLSTSFDKTKHLLDGGDGKQTPYSKPKGLVAHKGTVYTVIGSSGRLAGASLATFDHPVMVPLDAKTGARGLSVYGSVILELKGDRLDATFIDLDDVVRDSYAIVKK